MLSRTTAFLLGILALQQFAELPSWKPVTDKLDIFAGLNTGLMVAELELQDEWQQFDKPDWAGPEVTFDERYRNSNLVNKPFSTWDTATPLPNPAS